MVSDRLYSIVRSPPASGVLLHQQLIAMPRPHHQDQWLDLALGQALALISFYRTFTGLPLVQHQIVQSRTMRLCWLVCWLPPVFADLWRHDWRLNSQTSLAAMAVEPQPFLPSIQSTSGGLILFRTLIMGL